MGMGIGVYIERRHWKEKLRNAEALDSLEE